MEINPRFPGFVLIYQSGISNLNILSLALGIPEHMSSCRLMEYLFGVNKSQIFSTLSHFFSGLRNCEQKMFLRKYAKLDNLSQSGCFTVFGHYAFESYRPEHLNTLETWFDVCPGSKSSFLNFIKNLGRGLQRNSRIY
jgi:hypothetical protein